MSEGAKIAARIRLSFCLLTAVMTTACALPSVTKSGDGGGSGGGSAAPPQAWNQNGASVSINDIGTAGDLIVVNMTVVNGHREEIKVSETNDPMVLEDAGGNTYPAAGEEIRLQPYTASALKVNFAGPLASGQNKLTLRLNSKFGNDYGAPKLTVTDLPAPGWTRTSFTPQNPEAGNLPDLTFHHPNGLTLTLTGVVFNKTGIDVSFYAVNGHKDQIKLADSNSDRPFLQDERANRYYLVPPANNAEMAIPARQKMSGTLRFAGSLAPLASRLSLHFNDRFGGAQDSSTRPKIVINDLQFPR